jgi:hydroxymethylglutaryl-CoA lyase
MPPPNSIKLIECPRDAMQGWKTFIPTEKKVEYLNALLKVGFDTLDFGSFVSPKAIPQMSDTKQVLEQLEPSSTKLLAIIANLRGAEEAATYDQIDFLGFPFSVSPTFQQRNTNSTIEESFATVQRIQNTCEKHNKKLVIYLSMAFGNPYGDDYHEDIVVQWAEKMVSVGVQIISLADTVGLANAEHVERLCSTVIPALPSVEVGVHLHSTIHNWEEKLEAAVKSGCTRFDGALMGVGGCPMANDDLVGNMDSALMLSYFEAKGMLRNIDHVAFEHCMDLARNIFK